MQMKPNLVTLLEFVWKLTFIMALIVPCIHFMQNIMDLLLDVLSLFNEPCLFFSFCEYEKSQSVWM